ncbi:hypothetical protein FKP32DRAFT_1600346 [Trametes sanguinea]|nr:hypothetical protein FKP32DRAFT_1600346 [Trametes sanguinea]
MAHLHSFPRHVSVDQDRSGEVSWMHRTFGSVLIGCYLGFIIYGLNIHQAVRYFKTFPKDHYYLKLLVASVLLWETCHTAFAMYTCRQSYHYLVASYFNSSALRHGYYPLNVRALRFTNVYINGSLAFHTAPLGFCNFSCVECISWLETPYSVERSRRPVEDPRRTRCLAAASSAECFIKPTFQAFADVTWIVSIAYGMAAVLDAILTTVLIYALRRCRTGMQRTDSLLDVLILYAISTGEVIMSARMIAILTELRLYTHRPAHLLSSIGRGTTHHATCSVFDLSTFLLESVSRSKTLIQPSDFVWFALNIVATKVYPASLLAALNTRQVLTEQGNGTAAVYGGPNVSSNFMSPTRSTLRLSRWTVLGVSLFIPLQRSSG